MQAFAYKLASGQAKTRLGDPANIKAYNFAILLSSNEPLSRYSDAGETDKAARQRILDIPIFDDKPHLIFDHIPERYSDGADYADRLIANAEKNYGRAGPEFVSRLVAARAADEASLRASITGLMNEFLDRAVGGKPKGHHVRVGGAFSLVYAAGELAKGYGCLPKKLSVLSATLQCYKLHAAHKAELPPFADRLDALRTDISTQRWKSTLPVKVSNAGVIYFKSSKRSEIWIRTSVIEEAFPDWWAIRKSSEVAAHIVKDGEHFTTKRNAGKKGKKVRIHVFRLLGE